MNEILNNYIKDVRYDIFVMYSGLFLIGGIFWLYFSFNVEELATFTRTTYFLVGYIIILFVGFFLFLKGLSEFRDNYDKEKEINDMRRELEIRNLREKLKIKSYHT